MKIWMTALNQEAKEIIAFQLQFLLIQGHAMTTPSAS